MKAYVTMKYKNHEYTATVRDTRTLAKYLFNEAERPEISAVEYHETNSIEGAREARRLASFIRSYKAN